MGPDLIQALNLTSEGRVLSSAKNSTMSLAKESQQMNEPQTNSRPVTEPLTPKQGPDEVTYPSQEGKLESASSKIPVDTGKQSAATSKSIEYKRIINLFSSHHSCKLYDRHEIVLKKFIKIFKETAPSLDELISLSQVIYLAAQRLVDGGAQLEEPLIHLIQTILFVPEGTFREPSDKQITFFSAMAMLLKMPVPETCHRAVIEMVSPFITSEIKPAEQIEFENEDEMDLFKDYHPLSAPSQYKPKVIKTTSQEYCHKINPFMKVVEKSDFFEQLTLNLSTNEVWSSFCLGEILRLVKHASMSTASRKLFLSNDVPKQLCQILADVRHETCINLSLEIMWNLDESSDNAAFTQQISNDGNLQQFRKCLEFMLLSGQRHAWRQLRNDALFILFHVAERLTESELECFRSSGLVTLFQQMLYCNEPSDGKYFVGTHDLDDFTAKIVLLDLAQSLSKNKGIMEQLLMNNFVGFLLQYLTFDANQNGTIQLWSKTQLKTLQLRIVAILHTALPYINQQGYKVNYHSALIQFLNDVLIHDTGKLFRGSNVDSDTLGLVPATLNLLLVVSELNQAHRADLVHHGLLPILIGVLNDVALGPVVHSTAMLICASVCHQNRSHRELFYKEHGVQTLMRFLTFESSDPAERKQVILATLDCIWESIVGYRRNEEEFFAHNGIYLVLDLLESSQDKHMKRHVLGVMLDILENPRARSHVLEWRMKADIEKGFGNLLIQLWNQEETELGVEYCEKGFIKNLQCPLRGAQQPRVHPAITSQNSRAVSELNENLRAKIYGALCKIGVEAIEKSLTAPELTKLRLIQKYLDFKIGEVWVEIQDELKYEGVRPVSPDLKCISVASDMIIKKSIDTVEKQKEIMRKYDEHQRSEELAFYRHFLASRQFAASKDKTGHKKSRVHRVEPCQ